jgi:hypothetical protein
LKVLVIIYLNISCNAPRVNPFDPLNSDYNYGVIEGTVQSINFPRVGIAGVNVLWLQENIITKTDSNGRYQLNNIPIEDGTLIFYKDDYKTDTLLVNWGTSKRIFTQVFFNGIPELDSVTIYTIVRNQSSQEPESELFVKAWITDLDKDLETVFVSNSALNLRKPLEHPGDKIYETTLVQGELNIGDIEQTIGLDFNILIRDADNNEFVIGSERITRVIKDEVTGLHPTDSTVRFQPMVFKWDEFEAGYNFNYMIELYSLPSLSNPQLVHTKTNIPSDSSSYTFSQDFPVGDYYWVIWVIDQFQNRSRSKEATFQIQ